jgi:hypothetical protein
MSSVPEVGYGAFAEWLFLPERDNGKLAFFGGGSENVERGTVGGDLHPE